MSLKIEFESKKINIINQKPKILNIRTREIKKFK